MGPVIGAVVHGPELEQTRAELQLVQDREQQKGCKTLVPEPP